VASTSQARHPLASHRQHLARLGTCCQLERRCAVERGHLELGAERGEWRGHIQGRDQVIAFTDEALVLADTHEHVQVARRRTGVSCAALASDPDPLSIGDAGGHLHLQLPRGPHLATAPAAPAGLDGHLAVPVAAIADHRSDHLAEHRLADRTQLARAPAALAGLDRRARLGAVAVAVLATVDRVVGDLNRRPVGGVHQIDLDRHGGVIALGRGEAAAGAATEEGVEEVADRAEALEVRRVASGAQAVMAIAVVGRTPIGVRQDLVGLRRLLELLLGLGIVGVHIGVQLAGEHPERFLDLLLGGLALDAEHLVWIAWHGFA
jgi:hypothetical protein